MSTISTSGIEPGKIIRSEQVLRIIYALNGVSSSAILMAGTLGVTGSADFLAPVTLYAGATGSLEGTASWAISASYFSGSVSDAVSASYAGSSSYTLFAVSASYSATASYFSGSVSDAVSASYADTALSASYSDVAGIAMSVAGGASNYIPIWSGSTYLSSSLLYQSGTSIGIGTVAPSASAKVQIDSTTQGFLLPRMTLAQRLAISSPALGLLVYQTDQVEGLYVYLGSGWKSITMV